MGVWCLAKVQGLANHGPAWESTWIESFLAMDGDDKGVTLDPSDGRFRWIEGETGITACQRSHRLQSRNMRSCGRSTTTNSTLASNGC